jgi:predicted O-methyltransferase YrrM
MHHSDFIGLLSSIYKPKIYVELGLFEGETWNKVTPSCQEAYGVDIIDRNIKGNIFIGTTDDFFKQFNKKIDMVFIDADHRYESCKKDFLNSLKLINEGGIIIMHDTDPNNNNLFDEGYCGDSYKIVDFLEDHMKDEINVLTLPLTEAGLSIISKKKNTRTHLRNR